MVVHLSVIRMTVVNFFNKVHVCWRVLRWLTRPILALNCRLQVEQVNVMESADGPFVFAKVAFSVLSFSFTDSLFFIKCYSFVDETSPL